MAINAGLEHARGDLIVMTDDDVLPDRNWLCEWRRVANAWPSLDVFGGAIVPEFGDHPPRWSLPRKSLTLLYGLTPSRPEGEIAPTDVAGANLVIRRQLREEGLRFDENFLVGDKGLMGEDTAFVRRAFGKGHRVGFAPGARVRHIIHQEQVSWLWIHRRMFRHGGAVYWAEAQDALSTGGDWSILPRWRIRRAVTLFLRTAAAALCLNRDRMFEHSRNLAHDLGAIRQAIALRRQLPLARKSG
jgi:GT2 family glycosyltransferase